MNEVKSNDLDIIKSCDFNNKKCGKEYVIIKDKIINKSMYNFYSKKGDDIENYTNDIKEKKVHIILKNHDYIIFDENKKTIFFDYDCVIVTHHFFHTNLSEGFKEVLLNHDLTQYNIYILTSNPNLKNEKNKKKVIKKFEEYGIKIDMNNIHVSNEKLKFIKHFFKKIVEYDKRNVILFDDSYKNLKFPLYDKKRKKEIHQPNGIKVGLNNEDITKKKCSGITLDTFNLGMRIMNTVDIKYRNYITRSFCREPYYKNNDNYPSGAGILPYYFDDKKDVHLILANDGRGFGDFGGGFDKKFKEVSADKKWKIDTMGRYHIRHENQKDIFQNDINYNIGYNDSIKLNDYSDYYTKYNALREGFEELYDILEDEDTKKLKDQIYERLFTKPNYFLIRSKRNYDMYLIEVDKSLGDKICSKSLQKKDDYNYFYSITANDETKQIMTMKLSYFLNNVLNNVLNPANRKLSFAEFIHNALKIKFKKYFMKNFAKIEKTKFVKGGKFGHKNIKLLEFIKNLKK